MTTTDPTPKLDPRFSSPGATARQWSEARERLDKAEIYWLSTARPDGRPHVTPIAAIWFHEELVFGTGPGERKAHNLAANPKCVVTTGTNRIGEGFDVVLEGDAVRLTDPEVLRPAAVAIDAKYSGLFHWDVADDGTVRERTGNEVIVFRVAAVKAFGFTRGDDAFGQTRWRFAHS